MKVGYAWISRSNTGMSFTSRIVDVQGDLVIFESGSGDRVTLIHNRVTPEGVLVEKWVVDGQELSPWPRFYHLRFPIRIGRRWIAHYRVGDREFLLEYVVEDSEYIAVPVGAFLCRRVRTTGAESESVSWGSREYGIVRSRTGDEVFELVEFRDR